MDWLTKQRREHVVAMLRSYWRVLVAASIAAYLELGKAPLDLGVKDLETLGNAVIAALVLTAYNAVRPGETRFGRNAVDVGMGGEDTLGPGGEVQRPRGDGGHFDGGGYGWPGLLIGLVVLLIVLRIFGLI